MHEPERNYLSLIHDISELSALVSQTGDIDTLLEQVVRHIATHLKADVGSIYLLDEEGEELILKATLGLNPQSVGHVRMKVGEGLVGTTMDRMEPVCEGAAFANPHFKYFAEAQEDAYPSFLSVPIHRGMQRIGVLVVQHRQPDYFHKDDVTALRTIAAQLAGTLANARLMLSLREPKQLADRSGLLRQIKFIKGEASVPGFALAPSTLLKPQDPLLADEADTAFHSNVAAFKSAVDRTIAQLRQLQDKLVQRLPESAALIFEAHYMILKDPRFSDQIIELIGKGSSAPAAIRNVARRFITLFSTSTNAYIRDKAQDIEDLARRILFNLRMQKPSGASPAEGRIVIASQLYPSDILKLASESVAGIILVSGGVASHVAIVARSLKIPLTIARRTELLQIPEGTWILMDADRGTIYVDPSEKIRQPFLERREAGSRSSAQALTMVEETRTADGVRIQLTANINLLVELDLAREYKAEGIGLYRSEFPFIVRSAFPTEEEQMLVYAQLIQRMEDRPVIIRTLDIGGDKILPYIDMPREDNPELGLRSIRFSLTHRDIFDQQLRAILRAGARSRYLGIMFPMISSTDEFNSARMAVEEAIRSLSKEMLPYHPSPAVGMMLELPAVVEIIDELAQLADFFSIGTNDFIQYMLAVDRTNEKVADYYQPFHPAVLRALKRMVASAIKHDKPIAVCGEVAHDPEFIPFLIGIGLRRLSVDPQFLPEVQSAIGALELDRAEDYARQLLRAADALQIAGVRSDFGYKIAPAV